MLSLAMPFYQYKGPNGERGIKRGIPHYHPLVGHTAVNASRPQHNPKFHSPYVETPIAHPAFYNPPPHPFDIKPVYYDWHGGPPFAPNGFPYSMNAQVGDGSHLVSPPTPPHTPNPGPTAPATAMSSLSLDDHAIPLPAAARQLFSAVRQSIEFFDHFYRSYRRSIAAMRVHGDRDLLNTIWTNHIRSSMCDPSKDWARKDSKEPATCTEDDLAKEHLSFPQHQRRILERYDTLQRSVYPHVPHAAASGNIRSDWPDEELDTSQQRHETAESLKRKVRNGAEDLQNALRGMMKDYQQAKTAIRELKSLEANLKTYRACWQKDWKQENDDGNDSDLEVGGAKDDESNEYT